MLHPDWMILALFLVALLPVLASAVPIRGELLSAPLSNDDAWERLPKTLRGRNDGGPLPVWVRMLARELPKSAATLFALDNAQRTVSPLDPRLRAAMRWAVADANRCEYAKAYARADALRAGLDAGLIDGIEQEDAAGWSEADRDALRFARRMSLESDSIEDEEFEALVRHFGERKAASMVLLLAYANFLDRLLLCLGAEVEPEGPLPPSSVAFDPAELALKTTPPPPREASDLSKAQGRDVVGDDPEWADLSYDALQERLEAQRRKPTRLRIPAWEEFAEVLPEGLFSKPSDIVWYRIVFGYAPELAIPFETFMRTAGAEAGPRYDRVFGQGLFWVTTKAMKCPYCMGHCEMNWEVAGLSRVEIAERSTQLAGDDWSSFAPADQHAFAFARKLTRTPWAVTSAELEELKDDFGPDRAMIVVLNACRHHYMTRISNGFQLTLERENVFFDYYNTRPSATGPTPGGNPIPLLSDAETWTRLPKATRGEGMPLPSWAKAVATYLPRTAAAMLRLDLAQRTVSPLDPILRAKLRWVIARTNRCAYSEAYALADLKRAGAGDAAVEALTGDPSGWPEPDREPLEFARLHTLDAPSIPDALFARLRGRFGDKGVAAIVLLGAYGNFQDRVVLGLGLPMEPDGPLPPLDVEFAPGAFRSSPIMPDGAAMPDRLRPSGETVVEPDPEWSRLSYETLQERLEDQKARIPRLPIPTWDEVAKGLPPDFAGRPTRILWNLVCSGYLPELAVPWGTATRTMWDEGAHDRVFEESLFWVQTRALRCNYCMGHCEMLLEVAGLDRPAVAERVRNLAGDDWSAFSPEEQRAFAFARKLTKTPWELTPADYRTLEDDFGKPQAMALFWWLCRGLYMTRVSDGFQLPLEDDNVFAEAVPTSPAHAEATSPKSQ